MIWKWKALAGVLFIGIALSGFFNLEHSRSRATLEARHTAAIGLLCEFHVDFLKRNGSRDGEYQNALAAFGKEHQSLDSIQRFVDCVRSKEPRAEDHDAAK